MARPIRNFSTTLGIAVTKKTTVKMDCDSKDSSRASTKDSNDASEARDDSNNDKTQNLTTKYPSMAIGNSAQTASKSQIVPPPPPIVLLWFRKSMTHNNAVKAYYVCSSYNHKARTPSSSEEDFVAAKPGLVTEIPASSSWVNTEGRKALVLVES